MRGVIKHCILHMTCTWLCHCHFSFFLFLDKMTLLHQFFMDFLEHWIVYSHMLSRGACVIKLCNIILFEFHVSEGNFQGQTALLVVICHRLIQNFVCTCYCMLFRCSKFSVQPGITISFMVAVALSWLGKNIGLGLVQCNSYHKSDCHLSCTENFEHLNNIQ